MNTRNVFIKKRKIWIFAAMLLFAAAPVAHANLILNPSFETPGANWTYSSVDWWTGWTAKDGTYSIDLSASDAGWIKQSFATTNGQQYEVTFWLAGNPSGGPTVKTMQVSAGNVSGLQYTFDTSGHNTTNMGWTEESFLFTATGASTTLEFDSLDHTAYGPAIDLVSVDPASVPVPAPFWLFGSGLLGLAGWRRFRKS